MRATNKAKKITADGATAVDGGGQAGQRQVKLLRKEMTAMSTPSKQAEALIPGSGFRGTRGLCLWPGGLIRNENSAGKAVFAMTSGSVSDARAPKAVKNVLCGIAAALMLVALGGCGVSTKIIEHRHWELNQSIRKTTSEQLLLNIVRLRYDETPFFLQVSSISTQFSTQQRADLSGSASGTFPKGSADNTYNAGLGLGGSISYSESPVVTWSLPDSREYLALLMAPMGADQLTVLAQSGWDVERVFRVGTKKMNRLRNVDYRVAQDIYEPATYGEFKEALHLIVELNQEGLMDLAYGVKSTMGAGKIPLEKMDARAIPEGLPYGLQFLTRDDPTVFEPLKLSKPLFLRFSKQSDNDPRARRLRELLNLDPIKYSFGIVDTANSGVEQLRSESGKLSQVFDPETDLAEIVLNNRSVMEVLSLASLYVQVPEADLSQENVSSNRERPLADWVEIRTSLTEPLDAWLKVKHRDSWFYIAANDAKSRTSFMLLEAIFSSVVGNIPGAKPLLTLPVR